MIRAEDQKICTEEAQRSNTLLLSRYRALFRGRGAAEHGAAAHGAGGQGEHRPRHRPRHAARHGGVPLRRAPHRSR